MGIVWYYHYCHFVLARTNTGHYSWRAGCTVSEDLIHESSNLIYNRVMKYLANIVRLIVGVLGLTVPSITLAADPQGLSAGIAALKTSLGGSGVLTEGTLTQVIFNITSFFFFLVAIVALGALLWGGLSYILALGNDEKMQKAKRVILYAVIGVLLAGVSFLFIQTIDSILGIGGAGP
jgi:hypothetical protein